MFNYSQHALIGRDWHVPYMSRMGKDEFFSYVDRVYRLLRSMKPGNRLSIEKNVTPENIDLFIKVVCMYISEQTPRSDFDISFSNDCSQIICSEIHRISPQPLFTERKTDK